jgi:hypothetical protein
VSVDQICDDPRKEKTEGRKGRDGEKWRVLWAPYIKSSSGTEVKSTWENSLLFSVSERRSRRSQM